MELLMESKRMWLLPYIICMVVAIVLFSFTWENMICKTMIILLLLIQVIMILFFLIIVFFRWKKYCRLCATITYIGMIAYSWCNEVIGMWYIIIPSFILFEFYMIWNLGGVINCIIANPYKQRLERKSGDLKILYEEYTEGLQIFNRRNGLDFFTKVKGKKRPNLNGFKFDSNGVEMFFLENAILGVDVSKWERKEKIADKKLKSVMDKNKALEVNSSLHEEKDIVARIISNSEDSSLNLDDLNRLIGENVKVGKKVLRKRI